MIRFATGFIAVCLVFQNGASAAVFSFPADSPLNNVALSARPTVTVDGITLTVFSAEGPEFPIADERYPDGHRPATLICNNGIGVNNQRISNADLIIEAGTSDCGNESGVFNFSESMTFLFDRDVVFTQICIADLEAGEHFTVQVDGGPGTVLTNSAVWAVGNSGNAVFSGALLGSLEGTLIPRNSKVTFAFDAADSLDRLSDGNGSGWTGTPSVQLTDFTVDHPGAAGMGHPFAVAGAADEATVGCDLYGMTGSVFLVWSDNLPATDWTQTNALGIMEPQLITNAVMSGLSADTAYAYAFFATNTSGETVWSSTNVFAWTSTLYVSPNGADSNSGLSELAPLETIGEALRRIEGMARPPQPQAVEPPEDLYEGIGRAYGDQMEDHLTNLASAVTVKLLPGTYELEDTLLIDSSEGGGIHFEGEWAAGAEDALKALLQENGEDSEWLNPPETLMPVISGGREITGWSETVVNGVAAWAVDLPEVRDGSRHFRQLFVNGKRAQRSRWPKAGWFRMEDIFEDQTILTNRMEFQAFPGDMRQWKNLFDVEVVLTHAWYESRLNIKSYDPATRWVKMIGPTPDYALTASHPVHGENTAGYYLDNVVEALCEPGEWVMDRPAGKLYYIPRPGETIDTAQVIAPRVNPLFEVRGSEEEKIYLWDVAFKRIAFLHTKASSLSTHDGTANLAWSLGAGALHFNAARALCVDGCLFGHLGEPGVKFSEQTMLGEVGCCLFRDLGGSAVAVRQSTDLDITVSERTGFLDIHDNDVKGFGRLWNDNVGMVFTAVMYTDVENNRIRDGYWNGIRVGAYHNSHSNQFATAVTLRKNRIHDCGQGVLSDLSGLFLGGTCPYGLVEGNVVHNMDARDYTSPAIYLDASAYYWTIRNNWFYNCNLEHMVMKGWSHVLTNNVFASAGIRSIFRNNSDDADAPGYVPLGGIAGRFAPIIQRNIFLQENAAAFNHERYNLLPAEWAQSDSNLFFDVTGPMEIKDGFTLSEWRADEGMDLNSIEQDPLFVDARRGDFRVPTNSPAVTQLGFVPVDNRDAGPRSNEWAAAGAVWFRTAEPDATWSPADVSGLHCWLDAADLSGGPLAEWKTKTPYSMTMKQFDHALQPTVVPFALRGLPVVRFDGSRWMGNHEYLWDARQSAGRFEERPFTVFSVHRGTGGILVKGNGDAPNWSVGQQENSFRWNGTNYLGAAGSDWKVRAWQRGGGSVRYYENGVPAVQSLSDADASFDADDEIWLGESFSGDIAEVLIYAGELSLNDFSAINTYLADKWLPTVTPLIANENGAVAGFTEAVLRAELTVDGAADVVFHWGASDGRTTASAWDHAITNQSESAGLIELKLDSLSSSSPYYYRCFAQNGSGQSWAPASAVFQTLEIGQAGPQLTVRDGLQLWLAADDPDGDGLAEGIYESGCWETVSVWSDKSTAGHAFQQSLAEHQPAFELNALNGQPVVRFDASATNWLENATAALGQFGTNDFAVFTVHRSTGGNTVVTGKGTFGGSGRWSIGSDQNKLRWNSTNYLGAAGTGVMVRGYQRVSGVLFYSENGAVLASNVVEGAHDFTSSDTLYVGRRGTDNARPMDGDIAELLIYEGTLSSTDVEQVVTYLQNKWLGAEKLPSTVLYDKWADESGLSGSDIDLKADVEPDGMNNLVEYALGGNPFSHDAGDVLPVFHPLENRVFYTHNERTDDPLLTYTVQAGSNLLSNVWKTDDVEVIGEEHFSNGWKSVTSCVPATVQGFIRLLISRSD